MQRRAFLGLAVLAGVAPVSLARRLLMTAGSGGAVGWTRGSLSAGGSPVTVLADTHGNHFPGVVRLDASRVLVVYNRDTADLYGIIGTASGPTTFTWGSPFLIYHNATKVLCDDAVSIVDGRVVIAARYWDGAALNFTPFLLVCEDPPDGLSSTSGWGSPISVPLTSFTNDNLITGRVHKLLDGTYLVGYYGNDTAANFETGVLLSSSLTDWSARTKVTIGAAGANNYNEIDVEETPAGTLVAHVRGETALQHYTATSTDHGATWSGLSAAFAATGYPMFRRLPSGLLLTVYRRASAAHGPYWRQSTDDGATWSSETLLDATTVGPSSMMAYASVLALDVFHALAVYSIADDRFGSYPANLYSQVFTDSSVWG